MLLAASNLPRMWSELALERSACRTAYLYGIETTVRTMNAWLSGPTSAAQRDGDRVRDESLISSAFCMQTRDTWIA